MSSTSADLERARTGMIRYRILAILNAGSPFPVGESLIAQVLNDIDLQATESDIRRALDYLEGKGYVEVDKSRRDYWHGKLVPKGVDYIERNLEDDPGITRPLR